MGETVSFVGDAWTSTLARAFAVEAAYSHELMIVNLEDLQHLSWQWGQRRATEKLEPVVPVEVVRREDIVAKSISVALLIVDAPSCDEETVAWLTKVSLLTVVTTGSSGNDINNAVQLMRILTKSGAADRSALALCRLKLEDEAHARIALTEAGWNVLNGEIRESNSFHDLENRGRAISESPVPDLRQTTLKLVSSVQAAYVSALEQRTE